MDPVISILRSQRLKERREEKMGLGWFHLDNRWVAMSARFNVGGFRDVCRSLLKVPVSHLPDSNTLTAGNKLAQVSALEVAE